MKRLRTSTGAGMIASALFAAFFILLPLAIFGFELMRFSVGQMQLRSICDAAALSGAVGVASTKKGWTPTVAQEEAMKAAAQTFKQNVILGNFINDLPLQVHFNDGTTPGAPNPNEVIVAFTLLDQDFKPVATGDPAAKLIRCEAAYGYVPPIGGALGFTNVPLHAFSEGGLPRLDIILCYDVSGSMDDQTRVTFVKRRHDPAEPALYKTKYDNVSAANVGHAHFGAKIPGAAIANLQFTPMIGTPVNAVGPQHLSVAQFTNPPYADGNGHGYTFLPDLRCAPALPTEIGAPPGNLTDPAMSTGSPTDFTDLVVNIDGKDTFGGLTDPVTGLPFPTLGVLVEAARGNLNDAAALAAACPNNNFGTLGVSPDPRYQQTYRTLANAKCEPMATAISAGKNFYNTMNISANCHFGFVAFSNGIGTDENSKWEAAPGGYSNYIDKTYSKGGVSSYPLPVVLLDPVAGNTKFTECTNAVSSLVATGKTDIASAMAKAIEQLDKTATPVRTRDKAQRAIVLFTDGIPNLPGPPPASGIYDENSPAAKAAIAQGTAARGKGIRVFCIGFSQNDSIKGTMGKILKKVATKPEDYFPVDNKDLLDETFQKIAKSLIVLK
jgi:hypothetical protein